MHRTRNWIAFLLPILLLLGFGIPFGRAMLANHPSFTLTPTALILDFTHPLLGDWTVIQRCGTIPLPHGLTFFADGRVQGDDTTSPYGTYYLIDAQHLRLTYAGTTETFTLTPTERGFVLRRGQEHYQLCRGAWCILGDCGSS